MFLLLLLLLLFLRELVDIMVFTSLSHTPFTPFFPLRRHCIRRARSQICAADGHQQGRRLDTFQRRQNLSKTLTTLTVTIRSQRNYIITQHHRTKHNHNNITTQHKHNLITIQPQHNQNTTRHNHTQRAKATIAITIAITEHNITQSSCCR